MDYIKFFRMFVFKQCFKQRLNMDTKEKIINAASSQIMKKPLEKIVIRELAAEAKVNVAAINYHFSTKELLFTEAINKVVNDNLDKWLQDNLNLKNPGKKDLVKFLSELHFNTILYRDFSRTKMHHIIRSDKPDESNNRIFRLICEMLNKMGEPDSLVLLKGTILFNSILSFSISPDTALSNAGHSNSRQDVEMYIKNILRIILQK